MTHVIIVILLAFYGLNPAYSVSHLDQGINSDAACVAAGNAISEQIKLADDQVTRVTFTCEAFDIPAEGTPA